MAEISFTYSPVSGCISDKDGARVGALYLAEFDTEEEMDSTGHKMAAAPELYETLQAAAVIIGHPDDTFSQLIQTVLAKARGEITA